MKTIKDNIQLTKEERLQTLKLAKGGTWYDNWKPYCLTCSTMNRMEQKEFGFKCNTCGNLIGWDLTRLLESPLNKK